eukprot:CAMPEP_0174900672 /NCGR_PEP_ID=MMETSP0167-20121228/32185_1 /TAXON_ID=38298 /ORGANISM="Rhodella maculata, Strain CCMP736" /LENGTH=111 /DNA_ID=CAMNT_0016142131 /DNA_START=280 /DNA_END=612 /DNA_ORIENTATION=+
MSSKRLEVPPALVQLPRPHNHLAPLPLRAHIKAPRHHARQHLPHHLPHLRVHLIPVNIPHRHRARRLLVRRKLRLLGLPPVRDIARRAVQPKELLPHEVPDLPHEGAVRVV